MLLAFVTACINAVIAILIMSLIKIIFKKNGKAWCLENED